MNETLFLKLGGSLITNKDQAHTALFDEIDALGNQIKRFRQDQPDVHLLIGHGSGSFGHVAAKKYGTRKGVRSNAEWVGFLEVWREAHALDEIVVERFSRLGLPVISFPFSAGAFSNQGQVQSWTTAPIQMALNNNLLPIIFGDVAFDEVLGGTILSTEEQMKHLVPILSPTRILLAGLEEGVWQDFPTCSQLITTITTASYPQVRQHVFGSSSTDVTGGMASKVAEMMALVVEYPQLEVNIFSGKQPEAIYKALAGESIGTVLRDH
jgi:isopentenyl phosphate kinase